MVQVGVPLGHSVLAIKSMTRGLGKMNVNPDVNFDELARSTDDFNAAQLKAVCVEAGMLALRRDATEVNHEDFVEGIVAVQAKKKASLNYYA